MGGFAAVSLEMRFISNLVEGQREAIFKMLGDLRVPEGGPLAGLH